MKSTKTEFLKKLQAEASFQQKLSRRKILPSRVDGVTSWIGTHAWQTIIGLALCTATVLELIEKI